MKLAFAAVIRKILTQPNPTNLKHNIYESNEKETIGYIAIYLACASSPAQSLVLVLTHDSVWLLFDAIIASDAIPSCDLKNSKAKHLRNHMKETFGLLKND